MLKQLMYALTGDNGGDHGTGRTPRTRLRTTHLMSSDSPGHGPPAGTFGTEGGARPDSAPPLTSRALAWADCREFAFVVTDVSGGVRGDLQFGIHV